MKLRMGTRRSLLAMAQSKQVAGLIQNAFGNGLEIEVVGIETRGDQIQNVPLSDIEGKEFFVAELDEALRSKKVDFAVHSLKDLSLVRPKEFALAAIPPREIPNDILIWNWPTINSTPQAFFKIGTSAPRRLENLPLFLEQMISPFCETSEPRFQFESIRGNVNTRLKRLSLPSADPKKLDGVVLALAGLNRLCRDEQAKKEILEILQSIPHLRFSVLPLSLCPSAPGQGALAVECRATDSRLLEIIGKIHDPEAQATVKIEREVLAEWGGGCHQPVGATAIQHKEFQEPLVFVRGSKKRALVEELRWKVPHPPVYNPPRDPLFFDGMTDLNPLRSPLPRVDFSETSKGIFMTHSRLLEYLPASVVKKTADSAKRDAFPPAPWIFTSGVASWKRLSGQGVWVTACTDGLGDTYLHPLLDSPFLMLAGMPSRGEWVSVTHSEGLSGTNEPPSEENSENSPLRQIPCYRVDYPTLSGEKLEKLKNSDFIYWGSGTQFSYLHKFAKENAIHCCGPGRTAFRMRQSLDSAKMIVFPSHKEWKKWIVNHPPSA